MVKKGDMAPVTSGTRVKFGLLPKFMIVMLVVSLGPFIFFWIINFGQVNAVVEKQQDEFMLQVSRDLAYQVDEWIDKNFRILKTAAEMEQVKSMDPASQEPILKAIVKEYPWKYLVFTVDTRGMNVARNDGKPLVDYSDRQYYKDIMNRRPEAWQNLIGKTSKQPALVIAVPIERGNQIVGAIASAMTIEDISNLVAKWRKGKTGHAFLLDENSKVVAHPMEAFVIEEKVLKDHPLVSGFKSGKNNPVQFSDESGKQILGYAQETKYGWMLCLQQEKNEVLAELNEMKLMGYVFLLGAIILVVIIAWLSARSITKPLRKLTEAADKMSLGDLDRPIDTVSSDEIGILAASLRRMQTSLRLSIKRMQGKS